MTLHSYEEALLKKLPRALLSDRVRGGDAAARMGNRRRGGQNPGRGSRWRHGFPIGWHHHHRNDENQHKKEDCQAGASDKQPPQPPSYRDSLKKAKKITLYTRTAISDGTGEDRVGNEEGTDSEGPSWWGYIEISKVCEMGNRRQARARARDDRRGFKDMQLGLLAMPPAGRDDGPWKGECYKARTGTRKARAGLAKDEETLKDDAGTLVGIPICRSTTAGSTTTATMETLVTTKAETRNPSSGSSGRSKSDTWDFVTFRGIEVNRRRRTVEFFDENGKVIVTLTQFVRLGEKERFQGEWDMDLHFTWEYLWEHKVLHLVHGDGKNRGYEVYWQYGMGLWGQRIVYRRYDWDSDVNGESGGDRRRPTDIPSMKIGWKRVRHLKEMFEIPLDMLMKTTRKQWLRVKETSDFLLAEVGK
ncbi:hypothetical protein MKZ38_003976 [Zalerion maritima]|uniref:Uncharacterized protein n=1 Tax=Zalerion maritima TaxID=339359 RepID=A0AAD5RNB2_9PEZI|nr:hypothetical protein MKZ38_003976 [Zalerion maritima]